MNFWITRYRYYWIQVTNATSRRPFKRCLSINPKIWTFRFAMFLYPAIARSETTHAPNPYLFWIKVAQSLSRGQNRDKINWVFCKINWTESQKGPWYKFGIPQYTKKDTSSRIKDSIHTKKSSRKLKNETEIKSV